MYFRPFKPQGRYIYILEASGRKTWLFKCRTCCDVEEIGARPLHDNVVNARGAFPRDSIPCAAWQLYKHSVCEHKPLYVRV